MIKSIRIILEITVYYEYEIRQMNVNTNILNGDLEEEAYIINKLMGLYILKALGRYVGFGSSFMN